MLRVKWDRIISLTKEMVQKLARTKEKKIVHLGKRLFTYNALTARKLGTISLNAGTKEHACYNMETNT